MPSSPLFFFALTMTACAWARHVQELPSTAQTCCQECFFSSYWYSQVCHFRCFTQSQHGGVGGGAVVQWLWLVSDRRIYWHRVRLDVYTWCIVSSSLCFAPLRTHIDTVPTKSISNFASSYLVYLQIHRSIHLFSPGWAYTRHRAVSVSLIMTRVVVMLPPGERSWLWTEIIWYDGVILHMGFSGRTAQQCDTGAQK